MAINLSNSIDLTTADKIFIDLINNRITGYGQIPYVVPPKLIIDVIKDSARLFYKWYGSSLKKSFFRLDKAAILDFQNVTEENQNQNLRDVGFVVTLPSYVSVVKAIYEPGKGAMTLDTVRSTFESGHRRLNGIDNMLYVMETAAKMVEQNVMDAIFDIPVRFHYNNLINQLELYKKVDTALILECEVNIPLQNLYADSFFIRHVIGCTKRELKRVLAGHTIPLPGDATLNPDEICNNLEDIEKVEEILKASSGVGDIIMTSDDD